MNAKLSRKYIIGFISLVLAALLAAACGPLTPAPIDQNSIYTQAAATVIAHSTLAAGETAVVQLTQIAADPAAVATATPAPTASPLIPSTGDENLTPLPSATALPPSPTSVPLTATPLPPTATPMPCSQARFVEDITVKDGSVFTPGERFTKTWRVINTGECAWNTGYALVFSSGDPMSSPNVIPIYASVLPGEMIDLSVDLVAPTDEGSYAGYWKLRDAGGVLFGLGYDGESSLWVKIDVEKGSEIVYDFAREYCNARWTMANGNRLSCSVNSGWEVETQLGMVTRQPSAWIENGTEENEPALVVFPNAEADGSISGEFPEILVHKGDHFKTVIGCLYDSWKCSVIFQVAFRIGDGSLYYLGDWTEAYDGKLTKVDIDLSDLDGKKVTFVLIVHNNGEAADDWAFWLFPRIVH